MASTRDNRRDRYSTFGSGGNGPEEPKTKLTNRWEIVLVLIVVAAGIVITTIAAIKAKEKSDIDFNDDGGLINSANEVHEITSRPGTTPSTTSPPTRTHYVTTPQPPSSPPAQTETIFPILRDTTYLKPQNEFIMPTLPTEQGMDERHKLIPDQGPSGVPPRGLPPPSIPNRFDDGFNGFYGPDYDQEYDLVQPKVQPVMPIRPTNVDMSGAGDKIIDQDPMTAESNEEAGNRQQSNTPFLYQPIGAVYGPSGQPISDGLPAFPPPRGFQVSNEHNRNAELAADSAGFVLDELLLATQQQHHQQVVQPPSPLKTRRHYPSEDEVRRFQAQLENQQFRKLGPQPQQQMKPTATQFAPTVDTNANGQVPLSVFLPGLSLPSQANQKLPVFVEDDQGRHRKHHYQEKPAPAFGDRDQSQSSKLSIAQQLAAQFLPSGLIPRFPSFRQQRARRSIQNRRPIAHNETLAAAESGYFPFNEENIPGPVLDYNDYGGGPRRARFHSGPAAGSNRRPRKRTRPSNVNHHTNYNYGSAETRHGKKSYGILGSGNFEVIRGGIYNDEEGSASDNNYVRNGQRPGSNSNKNDDADYFTGDAVLGFQGYDNFQSASNQKEKLKKAKGQHSKLLSTSGPMQSSHPEPVFIDMDQDLMATS